MSNSKDQSPPRGRGAFPSPQAGRYVGECARLLEGSLPSLLGNLFAGADDVLYDLADKSKSHQLYTTYFDAIRIVRSQSRAIQRNFIRLFRQGADSAGAGLLDCDLLLLVESAGEGQELVPEAELEEVLAIHNLTSKFESKYRRDLMEMNLHLARLLDRDRLDSRCNPCGPFALCEAFRGALARVRRIDLPIRLELHKLFDKQVLDRLGDCYARCVEIAVAHGHTRGEGGALPGRLDTKTGAIGSVGRPVASQVAPSLPDTLTLPIETMQHLLERQGGGGPPDTGPRVTLQTAELFALLDHLGARLGPTVQAGALRLRLSQDLASSGTVAPNLAPKDEEILDLVFLFFEHLLQGNDLPDALKVLIGRMQIPVAKLALIDKGFFSDQNHPARRLLNHLGEAAVGWSEDDSRDPDSLYGMIERVVERLILDFDGDSSLFAQLDRFFVAFIAREQARAQEAEAQSLAELAERAARSEGPAVAAINACLRRFAVVPPVVETILRQGLQPALADAARLAPEGQTWRTGLDLADLLLWSVQPKTSAEERRQLLRRIPEILRALRTQLIGGGCDRRQVAVWLRDLQALHLGALQGEAAGLAVAAPPTQAAVGDRPMALGTWLELSRSDGGEMRLKLAWVSPDAAHYVFVDRHGRRGPELTREELTRLLDQGLAIRLGDGHQPIADRALSCVFGRPIP